MAKSTNHLGALTAAVGLLVAVGLLIVLMMLVIEARLAEATFPGQNGKIAYEIGEVMYTINPDGSGKTKLTKGMAPSFSPDGKKIVYSRWDGHDFEIHTINANGGGKTRLTSNSTNDFYPCYSPAGKRIAYMGYDGNDWEIYTMKVGGGGRIKVTDNNIGRSESTSWGSRP